MPKQAVLLLAHGTPDTVDDVPEYLRNVVSGRPLPPHVIQEIQHRYGLIGRSPLTDITMEQGRLTREQLAANGCDVPVYVGMRNWRPYIPDVVKQMRADGIEAAAVICMAPQNSRTSVGLYRRAVMAEAGLLRIDFTDAWAHHPHLIDAFAERLRPALASLKAETGEDVPVLFTAHSVPCRTVQSAPPPAGADDALAARMRAEGPDSYAQEARATASLVARAVPEVNEWYFAFQSQGASGGPWIGPTVEETLDALAAQGSKAVLLQPIGFLCDHVEILYDVDIAFREYAAGKGIRLERPQSLNGSRTLARAVAELAMESLDRIAKTAQPV